MPTSSTLIARDVTFIKDNMATAALVRAMRKHGLTATKVIKPIVEALEATKQISAVSGKDADEKTMDFIEVPDHATRLRAAAMAVELLGLKKAEYIQLPPEKASDALKSALEDSDEIQLVRAIKHQG